MNPGSQAPTTREPDWKWMAGVLAAALAEALADGFERDRGPERCVRALNAYHAAALDPVDREDR